MNKKVLAIVAVIALVAILGVCLVACNADSYAKKLDKAGYDVQTFEGDEADDRADADVEWVVIAARLKTADSVTVAKFHSTDDAKDTEEKAKEMKMNVYRTGKIVIIGTEQGVKDAK